MENIREALSEVYADLISCKNRALMLLFYPPVDKRVLLAGISIVFVLTLLRSENKPMFYFYSFQMIYVAVISFIILSLSITYWSLRKKEWAYQVLVKNKSTILFAIKRIHESKPERIMRPESEIIGALVFSDMSLKNDKFRVRTEITILLVILFFTVPSFFIFNLCLFFGMYFYVWLYENGPMFQADAEIAYLVYCLMCLYEKNPVNCRKFIADSSIPGVRNLQTIYLIVKKQKLHGYDSA